MTALLVALLGALTVWLLFFSGITTTGEGFGSSVVASITGKLTASQIKQYAANAGFQEPDLSTAVAIALAESGGDPRAYNPETKAGAAPGQGSYGLWQIYLTAHPEDAGFDLYDPQVNAAAAFQIYSNRGNTFGDWAAFNSGTYRNFTQQAALA